MFAFLIFCSWGVSRGVQIAIAMSSIAYIWLTGFPLWSIAASSPMIPIPSVQMRYAMFIILLFLLLVVVFGLRVCVRSCRCS